MIETGKKVRLHYIMRAEDKVVDSSREGDPVEFIYGVDSIMPGLQKNLGGLRAGEHKHFVVESEDAFGALDLTAIVEIPKSRFAEKEFTPGMSFTLRPPQGEPLQGVVKEVRDESVILDFNHPLAGKSLDFEVEIIDVI